MRQVIGLALISIVLLFGVEEAFATPGVGVPTRRVGGGTRHRVEVIYEKSD